MASLDVFGVRGGDICDCDRLECVPLDEDWRLWPKARERDLPGDDL